MSTRRQFLALTSGVVAASALPAPLFAQFPTEVFSNANLGAYAQGLLTQATFQKHVGSEFKAFLPGAPVSYLTLVAVQDRSAGSSTTSTTSQAVPSAPLARQASSLVRGSLVSLGSSFDLHFAVRGPTITQTSYTLDHGVLGRFAAFVVPGLSASGTPTCTASFNYGTGKIAAPVATPVRAPGSFASFN